MNDGYIPKRRLMIPKIPWMLETRWPPNNLPSFSLRSPEGRSTTRVGVFGEDGDEKE